MIEWNRMIYLAVSCRTFTKHSRKFSRKFSERGFKGGNKTGVQSCFLVHVVCIDYFYMSFYDHRHDYSRQRKWTGNEFYVCHYQFDRLDYEVQKADAMNSCTVPFFYFKISTNYHADTRIHNIQPYIHENSQLAQRQKWTCKHFCSSEAFLFTTNVSCAMQACQKGMRSMYNARKYLKITAEWKLPFSVHHYFQLFLLFLAFTVFCLTSSANFIWIGRRQLLNCHLECCFYSHCHCTWREKKRSWARKMACST